MRASTLRAIGTDAERVLWRHLRDRRLGGCKFRRQHRVGVYFADFACLEVGLIVEVDGGQHFEAAGERADARRTQVLKSHGFEVLRFSNREVLTEIDGVLAAVLQWLQTERRADPHPCPLPQAGEGDSIE